MELLTGRSEADPDFFLLDPERFRILSLWIRPPLIRGEEQLAV